MFISRWDVTVTGKAPENLRNQLGIAIAQRTYKAYGTLIDSPRCQQILNAGARPRTALWASTGIPDVVLPSRSRWPSDPLAVAGDWTGDQSRLTSAGPPGDRLPRKLPKSLRNARRGDRQPAGPVLWSASPEAIWRQEYRSVHKLTRFSLAAARKITSVLGRRHGTTSRRLPETIWICRMTRRRAARRLRVVRRRVSRRGQGPVGSRSRRLFCCSSSRRLAAGSND